MSDVHESMAALLRLFRKLELIYFNLRPNRLTKVIILAKHRYWAEFLSPNVIHYLKTVNELKASQFILSRAPLIHLPT